MEVSAKNSGNLEATTKEGSTSHQSLLRWISTPCSMKDMLADANPRMQIIGLRVEGRLENSPHKHNPKTVSRPLLTYQAP